jgi:hypothetical protein
MHVKTDHQVVAHGNHLMALYDGDGNRLAEATRKDDGWNVKSDKAEDTAPDRVSAIALLTDHAFEVLGPSGDNGEGYSTLVPHGLAQLP